MVLDADVAGHASVRRNNGGSLDAEHQRVLRPSSPSWTRSCRCSTKQRTSDTGSACADRLDSSRMPGHNPPDETTAKHGNMMFHPELGEEHRESRVRY
ncbi:hypothetical protein ABZ590_08290 [Streptomyces hirsutus]|uniref:hypothetical protein n=1 Tax=Streptomyces hirsutus TaxID=35620 RepID=UPI003406E305